MEGDTVRIGKRCYVGNLAWKTSWQDLKDKFREIGNVVYANVMRDDDAGRSKGWGIVEYETPEEAVTAIQQLNGSDLGGRRILVREDREDRDVKVPGEPGAPREPRAPRAPRAPGAGRGAGRDAAVGGRGAGRGRGRGPAAAPEGAESSGLQVVVQGIPWAFTWKELKDLFAEESSVERADVAMGHDGRSRGFGTVRFLDTESALSAVEKYNGSELEGRTLAVFLDRYA